MKAGARERPRKSFEEYVASLTKAGYKVHSDSVVIGKSGLAHHVDFLAERSDSTRSKQLLVGLRGGGKDPVHEVISAYAIALDAGAKACYITDKEVDLELARRYEMNLVTP